ncbi:MAG: hypothetical protein CMD14_04050 [Flavobacteriales bacterium]|nr:hypothetical protein [Flavobacteriales bacterium]|tara:strand:- start:172 stop:624 length:453 start_codon:yes stop_codon:yes gene_type:complete
MNNLTNVLKNKKILIVIGCSAIFICAAIFVFITYVKPKLNQQYVANKEFTDTNTDTDNYADLYFFYTSWCPHCKSAKPTWEQLKQEIGDSQINGTKIKFIEIDCDEDSATADKFKVEGYPTIKLVNKTQIIEYDAKPDLDTLKLFLEKSL